MTQLIEHETVKRDYGMSGTNAIVETDNGERLLICDAFGGVDTLEGGMVRWKHGLVIQLQPGDTLKDLKSEAWNEYTTLWAAVMHGYDESRPVLKIRPDNLAKSVGIV